MRSLRAADDDSLLAASLVRRDALLADAMTTVEIKAGYGLDLESERRSLRVALRLGQQRSVRVQATCLAAHAIPHEWKTERSGDIDLVVETMLPTLASEGLVDAVDAVCEGIAFNRDETARVFAAARRLGLPVKQHADQRSDTGGAALAAEWGALAADHVEHTTAAGAEAMARARTVAVLLSGALHLLQETR